MSNVPQNAVEAMQRKYSLPMDSPGNVRHNAAILGVPFISLAEEQGFRHEYDEKLEKCTTLTELYLLLGELYALGHQRSRVMRATVEKIARMTPPNDPDAIRDLKYAVIWSEELTRLVNQLNTHWSSGARSLLV